MVNIMKIKSFLIFLVIFLFNSSILACDLSQPDKVKHIEVSQKATSITRKVIAFPFIPLIPVKWIFNDKIQLIFPDNYVPHIVAGTLIFTGGILKEVPYDLLTPGDVSFCDIIANCYGIKKGLKDK
ncbi:MAG: hypothetical protein ACD_20C00087G0011 [uncultured bacterium]|nr:MAG: hypothetical protein ACD_20C00087G0011 [uncultured bacterium]